ncbi:hypothetical protein C8R44DRAFT_747575 [Mycena epipterygia]|nr:hypothetical protein C8R44DRAFT_747575 [Mycena epipterygia]
MHAKLDAATRVFFACKDSLDKIRRVVPEEDNARVSLEALSEKIKELDSKLKGLDAMITAIGATLPPLAYDASHIRETPMHKLDAIAQMLILLGVICHVIIGIAENPCNFIIQTVTLIIKCTMSLHLTIKSDGSEAYDAEQEDILKELPSSLSIALDRFKIDGKTTIGSGWS